MNSNDVKIPKVRESIVYNPIAGNSSSNSNPVNKSLKKFIEKKEKLQQEKSKYRQKNSLTGEFYEINNDSNNDGITVITCTNRDSYIDNILKNYSRQNNVNKELIIVLNSDHLNLNQWQEEAKNYHNVTIFQLDQKFTLGKCLNFAVSMSKYDTIAKFDDDDYYGSKYLEEAVNAFKITGAKVLGKGSTFVYFMSQKTLAVRTPDQENRYVNFANGSTLIFKKDIFEKVKFANMNIAEDVKFCTNCVKNGYKIYSTSRFNHVYIRYPSKKNHTWKISDSDFLKRFCKVVATTDDYINYADQ